MSDEHIQELTHGFNIHAGDHHHALKYIGSHMSEEQLKDMIHIAKSGHGADFRVKHEGGGYSDYKLVRDGDKFVIHSAHHG